MQSSLVKAHLALFSVALIYGLNYSIAKEVMPEYLGPQAFIFLRVVGAGMLFWLVTAFRKFERLERRDLPRFFICGLFGVALNQMLFFEGLNLTSPINAAIIMVTTPMLVLLFASVSARTWPTPFRLAGILIGGAGAIFLMLSGNQLAPGVSGSLGDFYVFLNAAFFGMYLVLVKPLMLKYKPLTVINWVFFFGMLVAAPFGLSDIQQTQWQTFTPAVYAKIAFVIIAVTFLTYLFNTYALKSVSATVVSSYIYLQPLLAALIAISLGSDVLSWQKLLAAAMIFSGVYLAAFYRQRV